MIRWRTKLPFCQFVYLCSIAAFLMNKSVLAKLYLLPVPIGSLLFVLLATRRFCARGDGMPPCCLATGRWGAARRRLDTGIAGDPAPCLILWRIDRLTWRKWSHYYRNTKRHYVLDTNDWPLLYYDFIETCSFLQRPFPLLNKETVQEMVRTARRIGLIKSPQFLICEKSVFVPWTSFVKKFPLRIFYSQYVHSLVFSKYFVQLFSSEHYVCLNICASAIDNLSVRLNPNVV